jgi:hypothetical protein
MADLHHAPATTSPTPEVPFVCGSWRSPQGFKVAATAARDAGYTNLQAYMPYPIHGIDAILGLERSWIGRPVFVVCIVFFVLAYLLQYDRMVVDFPLVYGGKPYHTWQLFVVVTLETGLLLGALANLLLCFHTCRLLPNPAFTPMNPRLSDDTFAIAVPITSHADAQQLVAWFNRLGAEDVVVKDPTQPAPTEPSHA